MSYTFFVPTLLFSIPTSCVVFALALFLSLLSLTFRGQGSICYKLPSVQSVSHNRHLMEENFRSVLPRHGSGPEGEWREVSCLSAKPICPTFHIRTIIHPPTAKGRSNDQLRPLLTVWPSLALTALKRPSPTKRSLSCTMCSSCDTMQNKLFCAYWRSSGIVGKFLCLTDAHLSCIKQRSLKACSHHEW